MTLKNIQHTTNFWLNNYLSNLDLLYKYKLKTSSKLPKLEKISLNLTLNKLSLIKENKKYLNNASIQRVLFFYLFSLFTMIPFIKVTTLENIQPNLKISENEYNLVLQFVTQEQLTTFLFTYFIETWPTMVKQKYKCIFSKPFLLKQNKHVDLKSKMPILITNNFNVFFNPVANQLIKEDSTFFITFRFTNLIFLNLEKSIKNLPLFWKNI